MKAIECCCNSARCGFLFDEHGDLLEACALNPMLRLLKSHTRRIHSSLHLKQTWCTTCAAHGNMGTNDVAVKGDDSEPGANRLERLLGAHIINNHRAV